MTEELLLDISVSEVGSWRVVRLAGELDVSNAGDLYQLLSDVVEETPPGGMVAMEIRLLTYVDSTGLSVLLAAHKRCHRQGISFGLLYPNPFITRLLHVTGLTEEFTILDENERPKFPSLTGPTTASVLDVPSLPGALGSADDPSAALREEMPLTQFTTRPQASAAVSPLCETV
jgi:anti-sigma B factor antagonist